MMKKKPTIQMVAELAGVSRGTVDRVLNNRSHVSPDVYDRVIHALEETGYVTPRNAYQKTLDKINITPVTLGVLLPNWSGHFKNEIIKGIESARSELSDLRVSIIIEEAQTDNPMEVIERLENLRQQGVAGIAMCTINDPVIAEKIEALKASDIPVITFNSDVPESSRLCFVGQDYIKSGRIAAELLAKCTPESGTILAAVGNKEFDGHRTRLKGFLDRMAELDRPEKQIKIIETYNDYQITYRKVLHELKTNTDITAIYMANRSVDGCTRAIEDSGGKGNICIVCHDISPRTITLLRNEEIDFSITQDLQQQGYLPLIYLKDYLHKGRLLPRQNTTANISIICSQNL